MAVVNNINIQEESVRILVDNLKHYTITDEYSSAISMVPSIFRELSPKSFQPRVVSIGPLHHEVESLRRSEGRKTSYMNDLFVRLGYPVEETLDACLSKVYASIHKIRASYVGMRPYTDHELSIMMVTDCCFILEFLYKFAEIRFVNALLQDISLDLLIVENQIPFFVLNDIFECTILKSRPTASLANHIYDLLNLGNLCIFQSSLSRSNFTSTNATDHHHILGLLHECYQPPQSYISCQFDMSSIHDAVELDNAGVTFKQNDDVGSWPMDMILELPRRPRCKPILKMQKMVISDNTEMVLRNLIAYEHKHDDIYNYVTSYVSAFDMLVDNQEDIALLVKSGVITNKIGSNEEAANMVNSITKEVPFNYFHYFKEWEELHSYYNSYWPRNIAWLKRTYFNNPWNIIALIAGIILFSLTITQTYLTAVQTYFSVNPKN